MCGCAECYCMTDDTRLHCVHTAFLLLNRYVHPYKCGASNSQSHRKPPTYRLVSKDPYTRWMIHLPTEILEPIFRSACTDDGSTGCALSGVSRHVRAVSAPVRYNSVALRGARQILAFLVLLDRVTTRGSLPKQQGKKWKDTVKRKTLVGRVRQPLPIANITVRHLIVADCKVEVQLWKEHNPAEWVVDIDSPVGLFPRLVRKIKDTHNHDRNANWFEKTVKSQEDANARADATIQDLLARLAPKLEHLCINQRLKSSFFHSPASVCFPVLVELTYHLNLPYDQRPISFQAPFPVLERLHVARLITKFHFHEVPDAQDLPASLSCVRFSDMSFRYGLSPILDHPTTSPWALQEPLEIYISRDALPSHMDRCATFRNSSPQSQSPQFGPVVLPDSDVDSDFNAESDCAHDQDYGCQHERDHDQDQEHDQHQHHASDQNQVQDQVPEEEDIQYQDRDSIDSYSPTFGRPPSVVNPMCRLIIVQPDHARSLDESMAMSRTSFEENAYQNAIDKMFVVEHTEAGGAYCPYDAERLYREWLERVQGGDGCWKEGIPFRSTLR
jgi:hypothetical protein